LTASGGKQYCKYWEVFSGLMVGVNKATSETVRFRDSLCIKVWFTEHIFQGNSWNTWYPL